jgi:hypothetical protein
MNKSLCYTDQSAGKLRLSVIGGEIDRIKLSVLTEERICIENMEIWASIIGASHAFCIRSGEVILSEVFACTEIDFDNQLISSGNLERTNGLKIELTQPGLKYLFFSMLEKWNDSRINFYKDRMEAAQKNSGIGLIYPFPKADEDPRVPMTIFYALGRNGQMEIRSLHSYPNEDAIVLTKTMIDFAI